MNGFPTTNRVAFCSHTICSIWGTGNEWFPYYERVQEKGYGEVLNADRIWGFCKR